MRHACPPTGLQLIEKLVVICCAHPAAYRDPQRFDAKQLQRCSVGHAALLDGSLPPASHFPHSSGLQTHRLLAHLPMQFPFPPCLRSWYMLMFQSPRVGEVYLRHDGGWVGGRVGGWVGTVGGCSRPVTGALWAARKAAAGGGLCWCCRPLQARPQPHAHASAAQQHSDCVYPRLPPTAPAPATACAIAAAPADFCELDKLFLEAPNGPRTAGAFSQQVCRPHGQ
jgi:hypothetical protein